MKGKLLQKGRTLSVAIVFALACESSVVLGPKLRREDALVASVATVEVIPANATLNAIGDTLPFSAVARDAAGEAVDVAVRWLTADTALLSVDAAGRAVARRAGNTRISAVVGRGAGRKTGTARVTVRQVVASGILTPLADTLNAIGDSIDLVFEARDSNSILVPNPIVRWTSLDTAFAKVDSTGTVVARSAGLARIKAASSGLSFLSRILIKPVAASIQANDTTIPLVGDTIRIQAHALDESGHTLVAPITFKSLDEAIIRIDGGVATGLQEGVGRVKVLIGSLSKVIRVTVGAGGSVATVTIEATEDTLTAFGQTRVLTASVRDAAGAPVDATVKWRATGDAVSVSPNGTITSNANGVSRVIATAGSKADTVLAVVRQRLTSLTIAAERTELSAVGDTVTLLVLGRDANDSSVVQFVPHWESIEPAVTMVVGSHQLPVGLAIARAAGVSRIVASVGVLADTITLTTEQLISKLQLSQHEYSIGRNDTLTLSFNAFDAIGNVMPLPSSVAWSSDAGSTASINQLGKVTGLVAGSTVVRVTTGSLSDSAVVQVRETTPVVAALQLTVDSIVLVSGRGRTVGGEARDSSGVLLPQVQLTWSSLDPSVVTVNSEGRITAVSTGSTFIAVNGGSITDTIPVTVRTADSRPNIVYIVSDDQDQATWANMPSLNSTLLTAGTYFPNFFVTAPVCCPSRATALRGQYVTNHGVIHHQPPVGGWSKFKELGHENSTVATWLKAEGYRTSLIGKYLNLYMLETFDTPPGWDEWHALAAYPSTTPPDDEGEIGLKPGYFGYLMLHNGVPTPHGFRSEDYMTDVFSRLASEFISRMADEGRPFFLYLAPISPHAPLVAAPRHAGRTPPRPLPGVAVNEFDVSDKPSMMRNRPLLSDDALQALEDEYRVRQDMLLSLDELIQTVVDTLTASGLIDNTFIFFTSDNGYHLGQHRLKSGKNLPYEEDIKVGMVVRGPGVAAGRVSNDLLLNNDLAPTIAAIASAAVPAFVDGRSVLGAIRGGNVSRQAGMIGNWYDSRNGMAWQAVRTATHTYVEYINGERELYDIVNDPNQLENIAATADPAFVSSLASWLARLRTCAGTTCSVVEDTP